MRDQFENDEERSQAAGCLPAKVGSEMCYLTKERFWLHLEWQHLTELKAYKQLLLHRPDNDCTAQEELTGQSIQRKGHSLSIFLANLCGHKK